MEGSIHGFILGTIYAFAWTDWKTTKIFSEASQSPGQDMNSQPTNYEAEVLISLLKCSVVVQNWTNARDLPLSCTKLQSHISCQLSNLQIICKFHESHYNEERGTRTCQKHTYKFCMKDFCILKITNTALVRILEVIYDNFRVEAMYRPIMHSRLITQIQIWGWDRVQRHSFRSIWTHFYDAVSQYCLNINYDVCSFQCFFML